MAKPVETEKTEDYTYGQLLLGWNFYGRSRHKRKFKWYLLASLIFLLIIVYSFMANDFLFVVFLILFAAIIFSSDRRYSREIPFNIFEDGIEIDENEFYDWSDVKNFHLVYQPPEVKRLYIDLKNSFLTDLSIPLENTNPLKVRKILKEYLEEDLERENETLSDRLNRWLRI